MSPNFLSIMKDIYMGHANAPKESTKSTKRRLINILYIKVFREGHTEEIL